MGKVYEIHARNGGVGVAVIGSDGLINYRLHREKFGRHFLFDEVDWEASPHGTAIPLRRLDAEAPEGDEELLVWLGEREVEVADEVQAAREEFLGDIAKR